MDKVDLNKYEEFVSSVTSEESNSKVAMSTRMEAIESQSPVNTALLMTGAIGMASEGGEFAEIVKNKLINNPKPNFLIIFIFSSKNIIFIIPQKKGFKKIN